MAKQLFGTDGIRGVAGSYPLDAVTVHAFGQVLGAWCVRQSGQPEASGPPQVVIGMDTRESGSWLAAQVAGGLARQGVAVRFAGVITTPGVAYLTRTGPFVAGVMISASHNPYQDNGLKVFGHSGYKLPDAEEHKIESEMLRLLEGAVTPAESRLSVDTSLDECYIRYLAGTISTSLAGLRLVVDCANGAACGHAPPLFERLGANVTAIGCAPDGRNINLDCGALHLDALRRRVLESGADAGVAFDGDADRAMLVARSGRIVDGDAVLLVMARALLDRGALDGANGEPTVVATVMSNLGLERALRRRGIKLLRTPVGDKYVLEEMLRQNAVLGGEQSGHVIFRQFATTGDGLLTALQMLETMRVSGQDLDALTADIEIYPQSLVNVRVRARRPLAELPSVNAEIRAAESAFGDAGRVLVRFSGTEPLARVMVEGPDTTRVQEFAHRIAGAIRSELGAE